MALGGPDKDRDANFPAWFETEDQADIADRARPLVAVAALAVIAIFAGIIWYVYSRDGGRSKGPLPTIQADHSPVKMQPEDRGGMDVPNQDKLVYDRGDAKTAERLAGAPEQPLAKPAAPQTENLTPPDAGLAAQPAAPQSAPAVPAPSAAKSVPAAPAPAAIAGAVAVPARPVTPPAQPAAPHAAAASGAPNQDFLAGIEKSLKGDAPIAAATPAASGGAAFVQLLALPNRADVEAAWIKLQKKQADILGGRAPNLLTFQKPDGTTWYRLRVGPFADRAKAVELCAELKSHGQDCLVPKS